MMTGGLKLVGLLKMFTRNRAKFEMLQTVCAIRKINLIIIYILFIHICVN